MKEMVNRQNKTADGLRDRLFDTLDNLIEDKIDVKVVESICVVSEQILKSARLEFEIELEIERVTKEKREFDREEKRLLKEATAKLLDVIDVVEEDV